jgi:hypothetical protein
MTLGIAAGEAASLRRACQGTVLPDRSVGQNWDVFMHDRVAMACQLSGLAVLADLKGISPVERAVFGRRKLCRFKISHIAT